MDARKLQSREDLAHLGFGSTGGQFGVRAEQRSGRDLPAVAQPDARLRRGPSRRGNSVRCSHELQGVRVDAASQFQKIKNETFRKPAKPAKLAYFSDSDDADLKASSGKSFKAASNVRFSEER